MKLSQADSASLCRLHLGHLGHLVLRSSRSAGESGRGLITKVQPEEPSAPPRLRTQSRVDTKQTLLCFFAKFMEPAGNHGRPDRVINVRGKAMAH